MSTTPPGVTGPSSAAPRLQYSTVTASANTGYEKSVSNLSWSYASFLSAVRAR